MAFDRDMQQSSLHTLGGARGRVGAPAGGHFMSGTPVATPQPEAAPERVEPIPPRPANHVAAVPGELVLFPHREHPDAQPGEPVADEPDGGTDELDRILRESRRYRLAVMRRERRRRTPPTGVPRRSTG